MSGVIFDMSKNIPNYQDLSGFFREEESYDLPPDNIDRERGRRRWRTIS